MNELKCKFESIAPITLHIGSEITTSCFYASTAEDLDARFASLVEVFLLKIYRCKLCQFTSSLKNKVCHHVSNVHQLDQTSHIGSSNQEETESYGIGEEIAQENKINEENLYKMLNTMSPESCSMSIGGQSGNANMVSVSEVNSLFEEEQSEFHLDESVPVETIPPVSTSNSPKSKTEDDAQCEHLLSLGLYRISSVRPAAPSRDPKLIKSSMEQETAKIDIKHAKVNNQPSLPVGQCKKPDNIKLSYTCTSCQLKFETKDTYKIHVQCHKLGGGFTCLYCGCFKSEWSTMELHIKSHHLVRKSYQCQVCQKRFMTQSAWKNHMRGHDKKSEVFLCTKCPLSFENENVRNQHVTCHHEDVFKCCQCGLVEQEWNKISEHLCNQDGRMKPFTCSTCNQRFSTEMQMKAHTSKHKQRRFTACPLCDQKFKNFSQMNKHQKHFHQQKTNGQCKKGKQKVENHNNVYLTESFTNPHSYPKREFTCDICSRKCSSKLALQRHMGVHAGEKPFHCQHCEYKTRLKASLKQHMRVHTGEKPFKCELCSYASIDGSSLRRHVRTHTSEKPYKCLHCSYSCIQKKSLDLHIRRRHHTGEMFKCSACQYSSPDKQLLHKHIKRHHGNENSQLTSSSLNTS